LKAWLSYSDQEEVIANTVKQSIERFVPDQGIECKLVYRLPLENLDKKELEKLKRSYDKQSFISKTYIISVVPFLTRSGMYTSEKTLIEIIHVADDLWITSHNFLFDDMAIWIGHQLKDYFNLTVELRNPEKTFV